MTFDVEHPSFRLGVATAVAYLAVLAVLTVLFFLVPTLVYGGF